MQFEHITCPHCGLLCDDLSVEVNDTSLKALNVSHPKCKAGFSDAVLTNNQLPDCLIDNTTTSYRDALNAAAEMLRNAKQPLISGLIADVQTCREAVALTEKTSGVLDHAYGQSIRSGTAIMQRIGEVRTTLAEVRNRADYIVIFGAKVLDKFPRLLERILSPAKTLGTANSVNKKIIILDIKQAEQPYVEHSNIEYVPLEEDSLEIIIHKFRTVTNNVGLVSSDATTETLQAIYQQICESQYTTLIWTSSEFIKATAEQTIQRLTHAIKQLSIEHRCVGLPLSGSKGEVTASNVATWQTGVPLPVAFIGGTPIHDPVLYDGTSMLENNEADVLVWIATYASADLPPDTDRPTIVIGHPNMQCKTAKVFIPAGIPGIDHKGLACRTDSVATLPLRAIRELKLRPASDILNNLTKLI